MEYSINKIENSDEELSYLAAIISRALVRYSSSSSRKYEEVFKELLEKLRKCTKEKKCDECVKELYWKEYVKYDGELFDNSNLCYRNVFNLVIFQSS